MDDFRIQKVLPTIEFLKKAGAKVILIAHLENEADDSLVPVFEYLKKLFQNHEIKKTYLALVYGKVLPESGTIKKPIRLKPGSTKRTIWKGKMEKEAITEYKVIKSVRCQASSGEENIFSLLRVMPKTGRTHQIRIHLASIHHPIVGDTLYGSKTNPFNLNRQFLHAESLEFSTEDGKRIKIESELPEELKGFLQILESGKKKFV